MDINTKGTLRIFVYAGSIAISAPLIAQSQIEEIVVWGSERDQSFANLSPSSTLTQEDIRSINVATTEDVVKFEPSVVIRRRFIGDSNGVLGLSLIHI